MEVEPIFTRTLSHRNPLYPCLPTSCLSLDEPVRRLVPPFLVEIRYPGILMGEVLQRYLRTLADYSVNVKKYQQAFPAPLPGNGCCIAFESSSPSYIFKTKNIRFLFLYLFLHPRYQIYPHILFLLFISTFTPATQ